MAVSADRGTEGESLWGEGTARETVRVALRMGTPGHEHTSTTDRKDTTMTPEHEAICRTLARTITDDLAEGRPAVEGGRS